MRPTRRSEPAPKCPMSRAACGRAASAIHTAESAVDNPLTMPLTGHARCHALVLASAWLLNEGGNLAQVDPAIIGKLITAFVAYYLSTRPLARQLDPLLVRRHAARIVIGRLQSPHPPPGPSLRARSHPSDSSRLPTPE